MQIPAEIFGPTGLLVAAIVAVVVLWRDHMRADTDDRRQRDTALEGWRSQTAATERLAEAIEEGNRDATSRHRATDR